MKVNGGFACSDCQYVTPEYLRNALPTCANIAINTSDGTWTKNQGIFSPVPPNCTTIPPVGQPCNPKTDLGTCQSAGASYYCSGAGLKFYGKVIDALGAPLP